MKKKEKPNYFDWISGAKQNLCLLSKKDMKQFKSKDDIEKWAHNEYVRHYGEP